jgi:hypothetical protein
METIGEKNVREGFVGEEMQRESMKGLTGVNRK